LKSGLAEADRLLSDKRADAAHATLVDLLASNPDNLRVRRRLAAVELARGNTDAGLQMLSEVVREHPEDAVTAFEYGRSLVAAGRHADAVDILRPLVERERAFSPAWYALGDALVELRRYDEARAAFAAASANDPFRDQVARAKDAIRSGDRESARRVLSEILARDPGHVEALAGMEALAMADEDWLSAEQLFVSIRERTKYWPTLLMGLSQLFLMTSRFTEARDTLATLNEIEPANPMSWNMLGTANEMLMRLDDAVTAFRRSLAIAPAQPRALISIGNVSRVAGEREESEKAFRDALRIDPGSGEAYWSLSNLKDYRFSDADVRSMEELLTRDADSPHSAAPMHFALAQAYEQRGEYDAAFSHFAAGNGIQKRYSSFDGTLYEQEIELIRGAFDAELIERAGSQERQGPRPIFIVGMPRTGSTLVEQILASHSEVDATMELPFIGQIVRDLLSRAGEIGPYPDCVRQLSGEELAALGSRYLSASETYRGGAAFFTDKTPENFVHIGLISLLIEDALFIDVQRHPMDTCLSAFRQRFAVGGNYTYDINDLGRYYRGYRRLMNHWDEVLPGRVHTVVYERLVAEPEAEIRRMLDYCSLAFEAACVHPERNRRAVRTPSSEQVRAPVSKDRVGFWKHYEDHLTELPGMLMPEIRAHEALMS